jgi:hypothetical protein
LEGISFDLVNGYLPRLALVRRRRRGRYGSRSRNKSRSSWKQGFETLAECAALGNFNSSGH